MLAIATVKKVTFLLFHTPTKYGSDRFRQIFLDHWERLYGFITSTGKKSAHIVAKSRVGYDSTPKGGASCQKLPG
jgi:hypothetical protein